MAVVVIVIVLVSIFIAVVISVLVVIVLSVRSLHRLMVEWQIDLGQQLQSIGYNLRCKRPSGVHAVMYWEDSMKMLRVLSLIALLILAGCGGTALRDAVQPGSPQLPEPVLNLPLPAGDSARAASLIHVLDLPGIATADDFGNVVYGASSVELLPPAWQLAGVIYALPVNGFSYDEITFDVTFDDPANLWLGIGDYQRGCWALTPAHEGITSVAPPYPTAHAPDGCAYFAVLAWNDTAVVVNQVAIDPNIPTWQHHLIDDQGEIGNHLDIARVGDYLYVAYGSPSATELRLARATETLPTETGHWDRSLVNDVEDPNGVDLAEIDSMPALVFSEG